MRSAALRLVLAERTNDCISYPSSGSLNNPHNRDAEMNSCRRPGRMDICEDYPFWMHPVQIDAYKYGTDIFDFPAYLCRIYIIFGSCILGIFVL